MGNFFGSVENQLMQTLVDNKVYEHVTVYDYQAVCYEDKEVEYDAILEIVSSASTILWNPLKHLWTALIALFSTLWNSLIESSDAYIPNRKFL